MFQEYNCLKGGPPIISMWLPSMDYGPIKTINTSEVILKIEKKKKSPIMV